MRSRDRIQFDRISADLSWRGYRSIEFDARDLRIYIDAKRDAARHLRGRR